MTSLWSKGKLFSVQNQSCSLPNSKQNLCRKDNGKHQINLAWGQRWKCLLANLFRREKYLVCNSIFDKQEVKSTYRYWHHNKYQKGGVYHWMLKAKMKWKGWKWSEAKFVANIKWKNFWCQCLFRGIALFHGGGEWLTDHGVIQVNLINHGEKILRDISQLRSAWAVKPLLSTVENNLQGPPWKQFRLGGYLPLLVLASWNSLFMRSVFVV